MSVRPFAASGFGTVLGTLATWLLSPGPSPAGLASLCSCELSFFGWWDLVAELVARLPRSVAVAAGSGFVAGFAACAILVGAVSSVLWISCRRAPSARYRCVPSDQPRDGASRR